MPFISRKPNFTTFIVAAPFPCSETAAEWRVKRPFRTRARRARVISLLIVPEALVKRHLLIGSLPRSSSKNYVPASAATPHTGPAGTAARRYDARVRIHTRPTHARINIRTNEWRSVAAERADGRTDGRADRPDGRMEERRAGVSLSFPDSEI